LHSAISASITPWIGGTLTTRDRADMTGSGRNPNSVQSLT
jgi:hypothetical protein